MTWKRISRSKLLPCSYGELNVPQSKAYISDFNEKCKTKIIKKVYENKFNKGCEQIIDDKILEKCVFSYFQYALNKCHWKIIIVQFLK